MGEGSRIDEDEIHPFVTRGMDAFDQQVLGVALQVLQAMPLRRGAGFGVGAELGQGGGPLDAPLAGAQEIQVGPVQYQHMRHSHLPRDFATRLAADYAATGGDCPVAGRLPEMPARWAKFF